MNNIVLSILICSTETRVTTYLKKCFEILNPQIENRTDVEVIAITDNKKITVGQKRNELLRMSNGKYVVFIDDDDLISSDYVEQIVSATKNDTDVICFNVVRFEDDVRDKIVYYSKDYKKDSNEKDCYIRIPNHLMCFKRDLAISVKYKNISFGEDSDYAIRIKPLIKTETQINKVLYNYMFSKKTTETQNAQN